MKETFQNFKGIASDWIGSRIPGPFKETTQLRAFGFLKIPLLFFVSPSVLELTDKRCVVKVPLTRRSRNHLKSMYFGALCIGADCAGGLIAYRAIEDSGENVSLIFKDFKAEFLKRAEGDVHFVCETGSEIRAAVRMAILTGERQSIPVPLVALIPALFGSEPIARFELTLSLKKR